MRRRRFRFLVPVAAIGGAFVLWDVAIRVFDVQPYVVASPGDAFRAIADDWEVLSQRTWTTLKETATGFALGAAVGYVLAILLSRSNVVQRVLYPVLIASQAIPVPAVAAPLTFIFGFGLAPTIAVVTFIVFFPVVVNVLDGLAGVDRDLLNLAKVMDGRPLRVLRSIELPATFSPLFSALKLGAAYAVTGAVIGEALASESPGLGDYLTLQNLRLNTDGVYAAVLLLSAIGLGSFLLMAALERLATPWRTRATARRWRHRNPASSPPAPVSEDVTAANPGGGR